MKNKFAMIATWPGAICAEREVFERLKLAAKEVGKDCYIITENGYLLDEQQKITKHKIKTEDVDFIITSHYRDSKMLDSFYYQPLWNPPDFLLDDNDYTTLVNNYIQNDDFLIYGDGYMLDHLKSILTNSPRDLENASSFVASFPESVIKSPSDSCNKLFYCGINWEILSGTKEGRHAGLLKKLDKSGLIEIYGPNKVANWSNKRPWKGYKSYKGEIPFDGTSMLEKINKCGIVLCLSSDVHRKSSAASSRIYEAIAGGAIIISDENPFVKKHFADTALFIDFNKKNIEDTYNQIIEKYNWIVSHQKEVREMILGAQHTFKENFSMNKTINSIYKNHPNRQNAVAKMLYANDNSDLISILFTIFDDKFDQNTEYKIKHAIKNIEKQIYKNTKLLICCDNSIKEKVNKLVNNYENTKITVTGLDIFNKKGTQILYSGQILYKLINLINSDFYIVMSNNESWFCDHITTLKKQLDDNPDSNIAYSGCIIHNEIDGKECNTVKFDYISQNNLYNFNVISSSGQCLLKKDIKNFPQNFIFTSMNGLEIYYFLFLEVFKNKNKLMFSKRNTISVNIKEKDVNNYSEQIKQQRYIKDLFKYDYDNFITDNSFNAESVFIKRIAKVARASLRIELYFYQFLNFFLFWGRKYNKNRDLINQTKLEYSEFLKVR